MPYYIQEKQEESKLSFQVDLDDKVFWIELIVSLIVPVVAFTGLISVWIGMPLAMVALIHLSGVSVSVRTPTEVAHCSHS